MFCINGFDDLGSDEAILEAVDIKIFLWIVGEGVAYIIGAFFYSFHKVKYIHAIFHLFVLLGSFCHMMAVWYILQFV